MTSKIRTASCKCGRVRFEARGEPFVSAVCYCADCQAAAVKIAKFSNAQMTGDPDGGTPYSTFRQDQWTCAEGSELLVQIKLKPDSPTVRYVASCCNSALYLIYSPGFWVSTYRNRFTEPLPPLEWRHKLKARVSDLPVSGDLPLYGGFPLKLFWRILKARFSRLSTLAKLYMQL